MAASGRRIVVAMDEGEESLYALNWCLKNVVATKAAEGDDGGDTLILLYARPSRVLYMPMDGTGYLFSSETITNMDQYYKTLADAVIFKAKKACIGYPNVKVESKVEVGDARDVICETMEKTGADMLVMGSHGYGVIKRTFLGSVSIHCAQIVKSPVLIVRRPKHRSAVEVLKCFSIT